MASRPTSRKLKKNDSGAHTQLEAREFDMETRKHLEDIDGCQTELETLNEQASKEIIAIEQRFNKLRKPFLNTRNEFIGKVPNFWATAFSNHPDLSSLLTSDNVEDCFHHLTKIEIEEAADIKSGFRFEFHFSENPYFHNDMLAKEYQIGIQGIPSCMCTSIDWKEGMSLVPQRDSNNGRSTQKRKLQQYSFFQWFNDHYDPSGDNIAEIIKDDLWQNPLQYFLTPDVEVNNGLDDDEEEEDESEADEDDSMKPPQINQPSSSGAPME